MDRQASLSRMLTRPFVVVGAGLGALLVVAGLLFTVGQFGIQPRLGRAQNALEALGSANAGMLDQETGLRAYVVTRDPVFLQPYISGSSAVTLGDTRAAADMGLTNPATAQLLQVEVAQGRWEIAWASPAREDPSRAAVARLVPFLARGKALFDRYRGAETKLQSMVQAQVHSAEANEQSLLACEGALLGAALLALGMALWRQRAKLAHAVSPPVAALLGMMREVEAGAATVTPLAGGPGELTELAHGLARMAVSLHDQRAASAASEARAVLRARQLGEVLEVARDVSGNLNLRYVIDAVARGASVLSGGSSAVIWLVDDDGTSLRQVHAIGDAEPQATLCLGEGSAGEAARYGRIVCRPSPGLPGQGVGAELAVPMIVGARVVGVIVVTSARRLPEGAEATLDMLATHAATAVEAARLHLAVQDQARVDALTRLPNRRQLDDDLASECARAARYGRPVSFVMIDVDHFKRVNDTYGHQAGDTVLQDLATVVAQAVRTSDGAYRYGGEEFAIILPETPLHEAATFADRLRKELEAHFATREIPVSASFGVADDAVAGGADPARLVAAADGALYEAKRLGRNRVVLAGEPALAPS